jgi:hypothetical protein
MIGGLEAAPGSAPIPQAVGLGIPSETKWTVLLADTGAAVLSAADIVRAYAEGKIKPDAKLWREGLDGWRSLGEIEPIRLAFQRAGLSLEGPREGGATKDLVPASASSPKVASTTAETASNPLAGIPPSSARAAAPTERFEPSWDEERATLNKELAKDEDVTRVAPTPWFVSEDGSDKVSKDAPLKESTKGAHVPTGFPADDEKEPVHPASRPDIGPRDTVRGQLRPVASVPPEGSAAAPPEDLQFLKGDSSGEAPTTARGLGATGSPEKAATSRTPEMPKGGTSLAPTVRSPNVPLLRQNLEPGPQELRSKTMVRPRIRSRSRRWVSVVVWCSLTIALLAMLALSYRYRQPKVFYEYLRAHRWDAPLDRQIQRFIIKPYRQVVPASKPHR